MSAATLPLTPTNPDQQPTVVVMSPMLAAAGGATPIRMIYGSGAPTGTIGSDGDSYINVDISYMYGPKANGVWPAGYSLKGQKGDKGDMGDIGKYPINFLNAVASQLDIDLSVPGSAFFATLNDPTTKITFSKYATDDPTTARQFTLVLKQGTGGNSVSVWPANVNWNFKGAPVLATAPGAYDVIEFSTFDGGATYIGQYAGNINLMTGTVKQGIDLLDDAQARRGGMQIIDGDLWILANAFYDRTTKEFYRTDPTHAAFGVQIQGQGTIPGEDELGYHVAGMNFWSAQVTGYTLIRNGGDPKNGRFAGIGGWELGIIVSNERNLTVGGMGIELDGNGTFPYGRVIHNTSGTIFSRRSTGMVRNVYPDYGGYDDPAQGSWMFGTIENFDPADPDRKTIAGTEAWVVEYMPPNCRGPIDVKRLLEILPDGIHGVVAELLDGVTKKVVTGAQMWDAAKWRDLGNVTGAVKIDGSKGLRWHGVLTGDVTLSFTNLQSGQAVEIALDQDATGNHAINWDASVKFIGAKPTPSATANANALVATVESAWSAGLFIASGAPLA